MHPQTNERMDLSCSTNRLPLSQPPTPGGCAATAENEDCLSLNSRSSFNSDSESSAPVCVRDMIKRYNSAAKATTKSNAPRWQSHTLISTKSSYFGVNRFGSQTNVKQFVTQFQEAEEKAKSPKQCCNVNCSRKTGDCCCPNRTRRPSIKSLGNEIEHCKMYEQEPNNRNSRSVKSEQEEVKKVESTSRSVNSKDTNNNNMIDESIDEANCQPIESSYQSKTTIAKTSSGVRIIIDIFFDQDQNMSSMDVVGSRVETDIPESRILTEFQQQAMANAANTPPAQLPSEMHN